LKEKKSEIDVFQNGIYNKQNVLEHDLNIDLKNLENQVIGRQTNLLSFRVKV
jgi:hypothetical protein